MQTVTLDTCVADMDTPGDWRRHFEFTIVTVSMREVEGSDVAEKVRHHRRTAETAVWDESSWDQAVWASPESADRFEWILQVISNGAFPAERTKLSAGQRRQLRDAQILDAHVRDQRDILVTDDARAFMKHGRRAIFQERLATSIMTKEEFAAYAEASSDERRTSEPLGGAEG